MVARKRRPLSTARKIPKLNKNGEAQLSYFSHLDIPGISVGDAISRVISMKKARNLRPKSIQIYQKLMRYFHEWLNERYPDIYYIDQIKRATVEEYIDYCLNEKKLSEYSVNSRVKVIKIIFNTLIDDGEPISNPAAKIAPLKMNTAKIKVFTDDQVMRLLDHCDTQSFVGFRDYCYILLALDSGLRINESLTLKTTDFDFDSRTILIRSENAKSRKSRVVPFSSYVAKHLRELIEENRFHFKDVDYLFISVRGSHLEASSLRKRLKQLGDLSGVSKEIEVAPHAFRHTAATNLLKNGLDIFTLSRILGHSTLDMTRRYLAMTPKDLSVRHDKYSPVQQFRTRKRRF